MGFKKSEVNIKFKEGLEGESLEQEGSGNRLENLDKMSKGVEFLLVRT